MARVFKTKAFARLARKVLTDEALCRAAKELEEGKGDDLGGNVWKKRVDANRARAIVATKPGAFWIFAYLFLKKDRENIDPDELEAFRKLAKDYGKNGTAGMEKLVADGSMMEICNGCDDRQDHDHHHREEGKQGKVPGERAQPRTHAPSRRGSNTPKQRHGGRSRSRG